jgi:glutaryl-CoA dehydrogenase
MCMKRSTCAAVRGLARMSRDIRGGSGTAEAHSAMRHAANVETVTTDEGTQDIRTLIAGRATTGPAAFA